MFFKAKVLLILICYLFVMHDTAFALSGVLRKHPTNPRYFTDNSGKAMYLTGSHTWMSFQDEIPVNGTPGGNVQNFTWYLDKLQTFGHNSIRLWSFDHFRANYGGERGVYDISPVPFQRTGPGNALDGKLKFDLTKFNQTYFDLLRQRIIEAGQRNVYVSIMLFEGHALRASGTPWMWDGQMYNPANNINLTGVAVTELNVHTTQFPQVVALQKAYIKKVIDTVNDLDNVMYEISNEDARSTTAWQYELINYIKSYQQTKPKQHPVGMTSRAFGSPDTDVFNSPADWVSPADPAYKDNPPAANGAKIILSDTDHLWGTGGDRSWAWKSFTRGHNTWYMDDHLLDGEPAGDIQAPKAMGHTLQYANKINLASMTPQNNLCSTQYCLVSSGKEYLIYQPTSGAAFTVNLTAGTYQFEWFNATSGTVHSTGNITATAGNRSFTAPFSGDAVFYLKSTNSTITPTGITPTTTIPPTIGPTATPGANTTGFSIRTLLHGIGNGGDNVSPNSTGTTNPLRPQRQVTIELFNSSNQLVSTKNGTVSFTPASGDFRGTVNMGSIPTGNYTAKIASPQYLKKTIPGILQVTSGQTLNVPSISLVTGDTNSDNAINIIDYNLLLDCFSDLTPARNCSDTNKKQMNDLTDDGNVNQFDYNLFLRELSVQTGN